MQSLHLWAEVRRRDAEACVAGGEIFGIDQKGNAKRHHKVEICIARTERYLVI